MFTNFLNGEVPWHWHAEVEVVFVGKGETKLECIGGSAVLKPGEMVLINSGILHRFTDVGFEDCRKLNVLFKPRLVGGDPASL
ncbi:cupin domain-containing protein [Vibrio cholerae]|nr:cupin domain-containing protein [Vibrio cholerae]